MYYRSHKSIIAYLSSSNLPNSAATLRQELGIGDSFDDATSKKYSGVLEKKWTSVVRLSKRVCLLPLTRSPHVCSCKTTQDHGTGISVHKPSARARLCNTHLLIPKKPRPLHMASSITGPAYSTITPSTHHLRSVPSYLHLSRFRIRRHNHQDLGLGTR